jgi:glycosyltransferase involved in cell wall biosynthesis
MSDRPLVTLALFSYNHERFAAEAIRGALSQTYSPLEIIISDDCSTDRTFEIIQQEVAAYSGPHTIRLHRNDVNLGWGASLNRAMERASGRLIVNASADDVSLPDRVELLYQSYASSGNMALSLFSNGLLIDEDGNRKGWCNPSTEAVSLSLSHMAKRMGGVLGSTHAWDKRVFEVFGPIIEKQIVFEDIMISFRSALLGEVRYIDKPLVLYRVHQHNAHAKDPSQAKPHELEMDLLKGADRWIDVCTQRLQDVKTMIRLFPERRAELLDIQNDVLSCLREKEDDKLLLLTSNLFKRLLIMVRALLDGVRLRVIARWVLTFFFPSLYLVYQRKLFTKARKGPLAEES